MHRIPLTTHKPIGTTSWMWKNLPCASMLPSLEDHLVLLSADIMETAGKVHLIVIMVSPQKNALILMESPLSSTWWSSRLFIVIASSYR